MHLIEHLCVRKQRPVGALLLRKLAIGDAQGVTQEPGKIDAHRGLHKGKGAHQSSSRWHNTPRSPVTHPGVVGLRTRHLLHNHGAGSIAQPGALKEVHQVPQAQQPATANVAMHRDNSNAAACSNKHIQKMYLRGSSRWKPICFHRLEVFSSGTLGNASDQIFVNHPSCSEFPSMNAVVKSTRYWLRIFCCSASGS